MYRPDFDCFKDISRGLEIIDLKIQHMWYTPGGGGGGGHSDFLRRGCAPDNHEMGV